MEIKLGDDEIKRIADAVAERQHPARHGWFTWASRLLLGEKGPWLPVAVGSGMFSIAGLGAQHVNERHAERMAELDRASALLHDYLATYPEGTCEEPPCEMSAQVSYSLERRAVILRHALCVYDPKLRACRSGLLCPVDSPDADDAAWRSGPIGNGAVAAWSVIEAQHYCAAVSAEELRKLNADRLVVETSAAADLQGVDPTKVKAAQGHAEEKLHVATQQVHRLTAVVGRPLSDAQAVAGPIQGKKPELRVRARHVEAIACPADELGACEVLVAAVANGAPVIESVLVAPAKGQPAPVKGEVTLPFDRPVMVSASVVEDPRSPIQTAGSGWAPLTCTDLVVQPGDTVDSATRISCTKAGEFIGNARIAVDVVFDLERL